MAESWNSQSQLEKNLVSAIFASNVVSTKLQHLSIHYTLHFLQCHYTGNQQHLSIISSTIKGLVIGSMAYCDRAWPMEPTEASVTTPKLRMRPFNTFMAGSFAYLGHL